MCYVAILGIDKGISAKNNLHDRFTIPSGPRRHCLRSGQYSDKDN